MLESLTTVIRLLELAGRSIFNEKRWIIGRIKVVESRKNEPNSGLQNSSSLFANNSELTTYELELVYNIEPNLGVSVGYRGEAS